jgi:UDP-N-acetyl-2-amino-2-deoxyglucuronate dehydrogenase
MEPIRFAVLGCGRIAKNHVGPLTELPDAELVAVCDLVPDRARAIAEQHRIPSYTNYHEMLTRERVDVVSILTPSGMHPAHAIDLMRRYRVHTVIEKPMALALDDVASMQRAATESGTKIFPIYQNRYNKAVQRVRQDLASGALGKPVLGTVRVRWSRGAAYYARDPWRGTWAMDGGALTNQGIHYIDLLQYLLGDVESVSASTATLLASVEVEDTAVATVKFASGALGVIEVTTAARPRDFEASISVLAEHGTAVLGGIAANRLEVYTPDPAAQDTSSQEFPDAYGYGHWPFFEDVIADLRAVRPHPISFDEGTRALRLPNAIYRSAEDRREVRLDEGAVSRRLGRRDPTLSALYLTPAPEPAR